MSHRWRPPQPLNDAPTPRRPKRRGYEWCRLDNEFPDLPIWRAVAKAARVPVHQVVAVAVRLECLANRSVPRGSVADMKVAEFAASLQLRPDVVARIRAALEEPDISWIDQDFIVDFHQRNPDEHDPTAAERMRRHRAKLRQLKDAAAQGPPGADCPQDRNVTRNTVTVTTDQIRSDSGRGSSVDNRAAGALGDADGRQEAVVEPPGDSSAVDARETAEQWLRTSGVRIVTERMEWTRTRAELAIERWRRDLSTDDPAVMQAIIEGAEGSNYMGAPFHNLIVDQCRRQVRNASGQHNLPIPPTPVRKAAG